MVSTPIFVPMVVSADTAEIPMAVAASAVAVDMVMGAAVTVNYPLFDGEYAYTPTTEMQTVPIGGKAAVQNITINPIPSNYGLITWNGSTITVS